MAASVTRSSCFAPDLEPQRRSWLVSGKLRDSVQIIRPHLPSLIILCYDQREASVSGHIGQYGPPELIHPCGTNSEKACPSLLRSYMKAGVYVYRHGYHAAPLGSVVT